MISTGHMLSNSACGIKDWLAMAVISGFAFVAAVILILVLAALCRYVFFGRRGPAQ